MKIKLPRDRDCIDFFLDGYSVQVVNEEERKVFSMGQAVKAT